MSKRSVLALVLLLAVTAGGCGGGSSSTVATHRKAPAEPAIVEDGVGMSAPIEGYVVAHRSGPPRVQRAPHILGASPCYGIGKGRLAVVGLYSDTPEPKCLKVSPSQRILVVNRSGAFFKEDESLSVLRLGDYVARIGPQEAALFPAPVGTYLGFGIHDFRGRSGVSTPGVLVVRQRCNDDPGGIKGPLSRCF